MEKKYILHNVYNTLTGEYEDVEVSKELYVTYKRTGWGIENTEKPIGFKYLRVFL